MKTALGYRKAQAYTVGVELEDRMVILPSAPQAIAYDRRFDRLLYHRTEWHYKVIKGTPEVYDPGTMETVICAMGAGESLSNPVQGARLVTLRSERLSERPIETEGEDEVPFSWPPTVMNMGADPASGNFAVYTSNWPDLLERDARLFTFGPAGNPISQADVHAPEDGSLDAWVRHCVVEGSRIYAIERDEQIWPTVGPGTHRVAMRAVGEAGALAASYQFTGRTRCPHTVMPDFKAGRCWVLSSDAFPLFGGGNYFKTFLTELHIDLLSFISEREIHFGHVGDLPLILPYWMGRYQSNGGRGGGYGVLDTSAADTESGQPVFITAAGNPDAWDPDLGGGLPNPPELIRWTPSAEGGVLLDSLGAAIPAPIHRTSSGLIGAEIGHMPVTG